MASGRTNIPRLRQRLFWKTILVLCAMVGVAWAFGGLAKLSARVSAGENSFSVNEGSGIVELQHVWQKLAPSVPWHISFSVGIADPALDIPGRGAPGWQWGFGPDWHMGIVRWNTLEMPAGLVEVRLLAFSGWFVMLLTSALGFVAWRGVRKHRPTPFNACAACGYSMRGLPANAKCPECGGGGDGGGDRSSAST